MSMLTIRNTIWTFTFAAATCCALTAHCADGFLRVKGKDIVDARGEKFFIRGTNLGHWLNPEGYMFGFKKCSSAHFIDEMFKQLVGPEETALFWRAFKDSYITEADIAFIARTGSNTVRLPFHYKLFTDEDYLGLTGAQDGFKRIDDVVRWCRKHNLRLILDMHDCPGGQTGDNIDDSHGYPWLFESELMQRQYCEIWRSIARRYANEPVVIGYDLMNEPISSRLADKDEINKRLAQVQKRAVKAIREVDRRHIVMLAGAQWNSNFQPFTDWKFDQNMMYTCHRYWTDPTKIDDFVAFRDKTGLPMFMGETGHNNYDWYRTFTKTMEANNIGWTYWPLKKPDDGAWLTFPMPKGWKDTIVKFADGDRSTYAEIQNNRPDRALGVRLMREYARSCKFSACTPDARYLKSLGLKVPASGE